jgi:hypothetical protein
MLSVEDYKAQGCRGTWLQHVYNVENCKDSEGEGKIIC